jgi:DNA modification methylase
MKENNTIFNQPPPDASGSKNQDTSKNELKKRANDLDGKTWTKNSISLWSDIKKSSEELKLGHPAIFSLGLVSRLIQCFTTEEEQIILDPFAGIGSTIVAARHLGKSGIGIELNPEYAKKARDRLGLQNDLFSKTTDDVKIYTSSALKLREFVADESVDFVVTSPPYWNILTEKRSADYKEIRNYGDFEADLGRISDYNEFLKALKCVFESVYSVLKKGKYCCVVVMDLRKKKQVLSIS